MANWITYNKEIVPEYVQRFKKKIMTITSFHQYVHELARAFQRHLYLYIKAFVTIPFGELDIDVFLERVLQTDGNLKHKKFPRLQV